VTGPQPVTDRRGFLTGGCFRPRPASVVRPPGAVGPARFAELCDGCGACAEACPADAIHLSVPASGASGPEIVAVTAPCIMCEGLACAAACPTGALRATDVETMRIARIEFNADACWARQGLDPGCDYCFDRCPLKGEAITYERGHGPRINHQACTGCGTCVYFCPAQPKALAALAIFAHGGGP
jgi:ferredoxin